MERTASHSTDTLAIEDGVEEWEAAAIWVAGLEKPMGTKNKGGKNVKKAAARSLRQKRADKKAKKDAAQGTQGRLV